jgi:hypothetical protein
LYELQRIKVFWFFFSKKNRLPCFISNSRFDASCRIWIATTCFGVVEPLSPDRGGPVRLVVPGWYGTNSVTWLGRLTLADRRAPGLYTTRFYNDPGPDGPTPVWGIAPESILVRPHPDGPTPRVGEPTVLSGWAWAEAGVAAVEISVGDEAWRRAELGRPSGFAWQRFFGTWTPTAPGRYRIACRCVDLAGRGQPAPGARNAIHAVEVVVA